MASRHFSCSPSPLSTPKTKTKSKTHSAFTPVNYLSTATLSSRNFVSRKIWGWVNSRHVISSSRKEMPGIVRAESASNKLQGQVFPEDLRDFMTAQWEVDLCPQSDGERGVLIERRNMVISMVGIITGALLNASKDDGVAAAAEFADSNNTSFYWDLRGGDGPIPRTGDTVVIDWDGYTIGYYGRIFEARNKTKGGSFVGDDKDFFKFRVGSQEVIPAFEEAVSGMALGGIRRIIVPPELGYPENDFNKLGPRPTTFSGQRALDFVLRNQGLIDKTLLFDIELLKIIPN
ncbi:hypothetical protein TIFTF001_007731 [Ficus carica]|uniref:peptidylprolyl isomerase n=1 Tax=Ficus carica TaxID=3494 RepID=A0AA88D151_FICCA|nr:hypothetical protein TIFTF001_007731 [Ficus carica]